MLTQFRIGWDFSFVFLAVLLFGLWSIFLSDGDSAAEISAIFISLDAQMLVAGFILRRRAPRLLGYGFLLASTLNAFFRIISTLPI